MNFEEQGDTGYKCEINIQTTHDIKLLNHFGKIKTLVKALKI